MIKTVCVCGAGTMGSGIALVMAQHGYAIKLFDVNHEMLSRAETVIRKNLQQQVDKSKITVDQVLQILSNLTFISNLEEAKGDIIIEAIIENLQIKVDLLTKIAQNNRQETFIASNTSSLSITSLQNYIPNPGRIFGLHFFNPAHLMKLVEIIKGEFTDDITLKVAINFCATISKTAVICKDSPGFIVNRVARHYYLESMKMVSNGTESMETVDWVLESVGFKLGPFKLMDMIGIDINLSVSQQLYIAFNSHPRFKPSPLQENLVKVGHLGRKTGEGFYKY